MRVCDPNIITISKADTFPFAQVRNTFMCGEGQPQECLNGTEVLCEPILYITLPFRNIPKGQDR